jgi:D-alanyl-D-alanine carboxypeptidase (penicillin-binding protein 5/6)
VRTSETEIAGGRRIVTRNDLLRTFPGTIGVKTGQTTGAGWSEVAAARREGVTIYVVLLGGPSRVQRNDDLEELLEWGFDQYGRVELVEDGRTYATAGVPYSDRRFRLVAGGRLEQLVRLGRPWVETVVAPRIVRPPVARGEHLGEVCVANGKLRLCQPLVAAESLPVARLRTRVSWYAGRALERAGGMLRSVFGDLL